MKHRKFAVTCGVSFKAIVLSSMVLAASTQLSLAAAANSAADTTPAASMGLDEIVVTAQRRSEKLKDVPATLSAMSGDDLKKAGVTNMRDLTAAFPGLVFTGQGSAAEPSIRGVSSSVSTPGAPGSIAIYEDGLYQSSQIVSYFDLPDSQRVEVLKGPQGALYGRNATGGAILITTLKPSFTPTGSITVGDGVFFGGSAKTSNHFQTQGYLSGPLVADELAGSIAASFESVPGYMTNDLTGGRFGKIHSVFVRGKLLFTPTENLHILVAGAYADRRDDAGQQGFPLRTVGSQYPGSIIPTQPYHTASELGGGGAYADSKREVGSLTIDWTLPGAGTLTSRTGYTESRPLFDQDVDSSYSPACLATVFYCITPFIDWQPDTTIQQELTFASEKLGRLSFVAGALYLYDRESALYNVNPPITAPPILPYAQYGYFVWQENVKTNAYAVYAEGTYDITDALTTIVGARFSSETKVEHARESFAAPPSGPYVALPPGGAPTDRAVTPRVSFRYALNPNDNLFASYNRGFKSGVLTALSLTAPPAKPETIDSFEVGIKHAGDQFLFNASAFYYNYKDIQVQFYSGIETYTKNAAGAKSYGFDLDGTARVTDNFKLQAGVSWIPYAKYSSFPNGIDFALPFTPAGLQQVIVDATGQRMLKDPEFTGSITADYARDTAWGFADASATAYHSSSYDWDLLRRVKTGAYTTLAGQISLAPRGSGFKYTLYGKNLTNKVYTTAFLGGAEADQAYLSQPREIGLKANYSF
jgi:iron complex outermembrane receptor protein